MINEIETEKFKNQSGIIRETTALSSSLYFSQVLFTVRGFIIAHVLGPSLYGVWSILRTIFDSAQFLGLGTRQAMRREVPFNIGKGTDKKAPAIIQTSLSWNLLLSSCITAITFILTFTSLIKEYNAEIRLSSFVFVINSIYLFMQPKFKSEGNIVQLSKYLFHYAILNTFFGISLLFPLQIQGLLLGMIISQLILFTNLIFKGHLSLRLSIDWKILRELLNIGFPIMILWVFLFLIRNVDKLIVFTILGKTMAGYYGLATFISSVLSYIPTSLSSVLFPRVMYTYGRTNNIKETENYYKRPVTILAGFVPIILGIIYINIGTIIKLFLPGYIPSINILHILIIGLFFTTIWVLPINMLIAFNKQKMFMYITGMILLCEVVLTIIIAKSEFGMNGIAMATTCMFIILSVTANSLVLRMFKNDIRQTFKSLGMVYLPFIYCFIGFMLMTLITVSQQPIIDVIIKTLIFLVYCIPLFLYTEKKSGIISKMFSAAKNFKKKI